MLVPPQAGTHLCGISCWGPSGDKKSFQERAARITPLGPLARGQPAAMRWASKGSMRDRSPDRVSPAVSSGCSDERTTPRRFVRAST